MSLVKNAEVTAAVKRLLAEKQVKQRDLAAAVNMHEQTLSNKLHDLRPFTLRDISRIADYFGVATDAVLGRTSEEVA